MRHLATLLAGVIFVVACASSARQGQEAFERGDYDEARAIWQPQAESGSARAQLGMGRLSEIDALNDPVHLEAAAGWYYEAAQQGNPQAMYRLGLMLEQLGEVETSTEWIAFAATCGEPDAIDHANLRGIELPTVNPRTLPRDCPNSTAFGFANDGKGTPQAPVLRAQPNAQQ